MNLIKSINLLITAVSAGQSFDELIPLVHREFKELMPCDRVALLFVHSDGKALVQGPATSGRANVSENNFRETLDDPLCADLIRGKSRAIIHNLSAYARASGSTFAQSIVRSGMRSSLAAALKIESKTEGVLWFCSKKSNAFDSNHLRLAQLIAGNLSMVLEKARLVGKVSVGNVLKSRLEVENKQLREVIVNSPSLSELIGDSHIWKKTLQKVELVAETNSTVLIRGETGTGKELVARAVHRLSSRRDKPFVAINCGALTPELVSSELFGHERGAFTGALQRKLGRLELAEGGTLFLDEVAELPPELQVKLLRVLQEREFERVGGTQTIKCNVRIIAATHRNLEKERANGKFREDLYFRLNVFPILVPALRERKEDIEPMLNHFLNRYSQKMNKQFDGIAPETLDRCYLYHWPGNVRELENLVERSVILCRENTFYMDPLFEPDTEPRASSQAQTLDEVIKTHLLQTLKLSRGKIYGNKGAAERLGIKPSTLQAKMKKLGIGRFDYEQT